MEEGLVGAMAQLQWLEAWTEKVNGDDHGHDCGSCKHVQLVCRHLPKPCATLSAL